jgi:glycosyltransferase involved in cell wall biosynthesis
MKVAIISRGWWPAIKGGSEKFIYRIALGLSKKGYETYVVTRQAKDLSNDGSYSFLLVKHKILLPIVSTYTFSRKAGSLVNKLNPDIAIANSYWGETSLLYIKKEIKKMAVIHDVGLFRSPLAKRDLIKHVLRTNALKKVTREAGLIVVPSEIVKQDLIRFLRVDEHKIRVLGFEGVDGPFQYSYFDNGKIDIVQVGRYAPNKGQVILLKAIEIVSDKIKNSNIAIKVHIAGSLTSKKYYNEVAHIAERINKKLGQEVIRVLLNVEDKDIEHLYRIADICVAPSIGEEGYGLTILECMAHGKPVIASDVFKETGIADNDRAIIVPRGDITELANAILDYISNPNKFKAIAEKGLEFARKCTWENVVNKFEEYIKELK